MSRAIACDCGGIRAASIDKCRLEAPTSASRLPGSDVCFPFEALWFISFVVGSRTLCSGWVGLGWRFFILGVFFFFSFSLPRPPRLSPREGGKSCGVHSLILFPHLSGRGRFGADAARKNISSPLRAAVDELAEKMFCFFAGAEHKTQRAKIPRLRQQTTTETINSPSLHHPSLPSLFSVLSSAGCRRCPRDRCRRRGYVCPCCAGGYGARAGG